MAQEAAITSTGENRRLTRLGRWIQSGFTGMFHGLFFKKEPFPADEYGKLMRSYMTTRNWLDRASSWWAEQPVLIKTIYVAGFSAISALSGLFFGAPVLMGLLATAITLSMHAFLISHEINRLKWASVCAKATIAMQNTTMAFKEQLSVRQESTQEIHNSLCVLAKSHQLNVDELAFVQTIDHIETPCEVNRFSLFGNSLLPTSTAYINDEDEKLIQRM